MCLQKTVLLFLHARCTTDPMDTMQPCPIDIRSLTGTESPMYVFFPILTHPAMKLEEHKEVVIAIGEPFAREKMMKKILGLGISLAYPLIHPSAKVNSACQIGVGTVIGYSTIISFDAQIDNNG